MRAVKRAPHPRDKNSLFQAFLSPPGWEGKVTPEPSHPPPGESPRAAKEKWWEMIRFVGNDQVCATEWLSSITLTARDVLELPPCNTGLIPLHGGTRGSGRSVPHRRAGSRFAGHQQQSKYSVTPWQRTQISFSPDSAPSAAPTSCLPSMGCLGRVQKNTDTKPGSQGLKGLCFVPLR